MNSRRTVIIAAALAQSGARVLYKPHPRVALSDDVGVMKGHEQILKLMDRAISSEPRFAATWSALSHPP